MPRGRMGGRHGMSTEKAKDFKGTMKKLMGYLAQYKIGLLLVVIFAIGSTIFNIAGPKILGKATTELFHGLISKVSGGSGIDFDKIAKILIGLMCLYVCSALFSFIQGYIMTGVSQKLTYRMRKEISEKIDRLPMGYFDKMTHGEILSRITNDVDTLSQSLNQSEKLSPENHIFSKKFESCRNSSQKRKKQVILLLLRQSLDYWA